jgi:hypothetical protein
MGPPPPPPGAASTRCFAATRRRGWAPAGPWWRGRGRISKQARTHSTEDPAAAAAAGLAGLGPFTSREPQPPPPLIIGSSARAEAVSQTWVRVSTCRPRVTGIGGAREQSHSHSGGARDAT